MVRVPKKAVRGGDFIGQGTYGCVFSPPVPTVSRVSGNDMIGKVMDEEDARMEYDRIKEFKRIDPHEKYGIYGSAPEKIDAKRFVSGAGGPAERAKCTLLKIHEDDAYQLSQTKARGDLELLRYDHSRASFLNVWDSHNLPNLFRGLAAYHRAGLAHLDVKPDNVVFFGYNEMRQRKSVTVATKFAFIDFGLSEKLRSLTTYNPDVKLGSAYFIYPVIANLLFHKGEGESYKLKADSETVLSYLSNAETIRWLRAIIIKHEQAFYDDEWYPKLMFQPVDDYKNFLTSHKLTTTDKNVRERMAIAIDIYSLGSLVCYVVHKTTGMVYNDYLTRFDFDYGMIPQHTTKALAEVLHSMFHFKESSLAKMLRSILSKMVYTLSRE